MPKRRGVSKKKSSSAVLVLVVLFILGIFYLLTGKDPGGIFGSGTTTPTSVVSTGATSAPGASSDWWEVYFTDPLHVNNPANWQSSIEGRLIDKINAAQTSIHIASFEFDLTPVAEALVAAKKRGVDVRWVTDDESGLAVDEDPGHGQFAMLQEAGIEVRSDDRAALMHNKFWIFDGKIAWTGSTNITISGVFQQNNNTIVIHSPEVAAIYEREFAELWDGKYGPKSPSTVDQQSLAVNGTPIQIYFSPEDHVLDHMIPVVSSATKSIHFMAFSFTDYPLAKAMLDRASAGVDVSGVFEKVGSETDSSELHTFFCAKVPARQDGNPKFLHDKVIIVDNRLVISGSFNFSTNATESNDENVMIIDNPQIANLYTQEFQRVWAIATDPEPGKFTCR
jgi:Phosphatidylserine/phosphatidylglycerophosphate/cardiolipin synthases and related enzymes